MTEAFVQFEELAQTLKANATNAQILVEVSSDRNSISKALNILGDIGIEPSRYEILRDGDPAYVLFYISQGDIREAVLRLGEAGFTRLRGINRLMDKQFLRMSV